VARQQLLEHEAKALVAASGVAVPEGALAASPEEAAAIAGRLGGRVVVKAQVPCGGRARGGGVAIVAAGAAGAAAAAMLGGEVRGHRVDRVLVERYLAGARELFLALLLDARARAPRLLVSRGGGTDVEAGSEPMGSCAIPVLGGLHDWHVWRCANRAGVDRATAARLLGPARRAYQAFWEHRAELLEINPLLIPPEGPPVAADVRLIPAAGAEGGEPGVDEPAGAYVELDAGGDVGLLTTGAGASMLLVDLLREVGLRPVNFCDVRASGLRRSPARLVGTLRRIGAHRALRVIAVNVFGSITDLGEFVELLLAALREAPPPVPVIVRIEGLGAAAGRRRLAAAGLACADDLDQLVELVGRAASAGPA
jgi:succinyl-CoA synthetase beta subunit